MSFLSGKFPSAYKTAQITPILKKPGLDDSLPQNYRPISNLNTISKLIERLALKQLGPHIESSQNFNEQQSAYRKKHSTETALISTLSDVYSSIDSGASSILISLDISAAFDTVQHDTLLARLSHTFTVSDLSIEWLRSYLSSRKQFVHLNGHRSQMHTVTCGVPQGSVLGSLLFTTYISPIANLITSFNVGHQQYADDTQLYISIQPTSIQQSVDKLQKCLRAVQSWFAHNGLTLNPTKSEAILLSTRQRLDKLASLGFTSVAFDGAPIPFNEEIHTLGVTIDSQLSFNTHVDNLCRTGYYHIRGIRRIRNVISESDANALASSFVQTRLDYCNSLLFNTSEFNLNRMQRLQNCLARVVTQQSRNTSSAVILNRLHWLPVRKRVQYKIASLTHQALETGLPKRLRSIINPLTSTLYCIVHALYRQNTATR